MSEKEYGLYMPDGSFKSDKQINTEHNPIHKEWNNPYDEISFNDRIEETIRRQEWRDRQDRIPESAEVVVNTEKPIAICNLADLHMGGAKVDYEYLKYLTDTIKYNDNAFCFLGGDLAETICWNSGQNDSILNFQEQHEMLYSMLKKLKGKILAGVIGNHNWEERNWVSKYQEYLRNADAPLFDNLGWLTLQLDSKNESVPYYITLAHQLKGYSYHNPNHPQGRNSKEVEGSDIIVSNHTHFDGVQSTSKSLFGGKHRGLTFINGFTLKPNDKFLRGKGNPNSNVGANWLYLSPYEKKHMAIPTTELAIEVMGWD